MPPIISWFIVVPKGRVNATAVAYATETTPFKCWADVSVDAPAAAIAELLL